MTLAYAIAADLIGDDETDPVTVGFLSQAYASVLDVDEADRLLLRASELIDGAVRQPYDTDDDGLATDSDVAAALRDATCAQVEQWVEVDEANAIDGLAGTQRALGGGVRAPELAPRARRILLNAGLVQPMRIDQVEAL